MDFIQFLDEVQVGQEQATRGLNTEARARMAGAAMPATRHESCHLVLRFVVARFAAVGAIILPILSEPDAVVRLAERAIPVTPAVFFGLITNNAMKFFFAHGRVPRSRG
jgi:hypothetical protein